MAGLLVLVVVIGVGVWWRQRRIRSAWDAVAVRHGLEMARSPQNDFPMLAGSLDGYRVEIYDTGHGPTDTTRVVVHLRKAPPVRLVVATRKLIGGEPAPLNHEHVRLGDPEFDAMCTVDGDLSEALAVLNAVARRLLGSVCHRPPAIQVGGARVEITEAALILDEAGLLKWHTRLDNRLRDLALLAGQLERLEPQLAARILRNLNAEPLPAVRRLALMTLLRQHAGSPEALEAAEIGASDNNPEVQLEAAIARGDAGFDLVIEIAETQPPRPMLVRALQFLGRHLTAERIEAILANARVGQVTPVERLAIREAGKQHQNHLAGRLVELLEGADPVTARSLALSLAWIGDASTEPHLIQLLSHDDVDLRRAAAEALGRVGSATAVDALKAQIQGWESPRLNRDMRAAIAQIEERDNTVSGKG